MAHRPPWGGDGPAWAQIITPEINFRGRNRRSVESLHSPARPLEPPYSLSRPPRSQDATRPKLMGLSWAIMGLPWGRHGRAWWHGAPLTGTVKARPLSQLADFVRRAHVRRAQTVVVPVLSASSRPCDVMSHRDRTNGDRVLGIIGGSPRSSSRSWGSTPAAGRPPSGPGAASSPPSRWRPRRTGHGSPTAGRRTGTPAAPGTPAATTRTTPSCPRPTT